MKLVNNMVRRREKKQRKMSVDWSTIMGDKFEECHYSDTIWGNTIRTVEYLEVSGGASKSSFVCP